MDYFGRNPFVMNILQANTHCKSLNQNSLHAGNKGGPHPVRESKTRASLPKMGTMNYFEFFDLPRRLTLNVVALEKQFYTMSRRLHPDRFASKPLAEQEAALAQSSLLNDAYRTLKDRIFKTQYLLKLEGVELEEQSKAATEAARASGTEKKQVVPPELLEEVFELNMQLQEMRAANQMGEDEPELRRDLMTAKDAFDAKMVETQSSRALGGVGRRCGRWRRGRKEPEPKRRWWSC